MRISVEYIKYNNYKIVYIVPKFQCFVNKNVAEKNVAGRNIAGKGIAKM